MARKPRSNVRTLWLGVFEIVISGALGISLPSLLAAIRHGGHCISITRSSYPQKDSWSISAIPRSLHVLTVDIGDFIASTSSTPLRTLQNAVDALAPISTPPARHDLTSFKASDLPKLADYLQRVSPEETELVEFDNMDKLDVR